MRGITGDEIKTWAERVEAASVLPELVRRLILATTNPASIEMRADGGVRLPVWDGAVCTSAGSTFCPAGLSYWELSTDSRVKKKLDGDFRKRADSSADVLACYVAVTAHRYKNKTKWVADGRSKGIWADVRCLDADDLATWLSQAPAVAAWFAAEQLAQPTGDLSTLEEALEEWSGAAPRPLPWSLLLLGKARTSAAERVRQWALGPPDRLLVRADSYEEAVAFAASALTGNGMHRTELAARSIVVRSDAALRWCNRQTAPLVLLPATVGMDTGGKSRHHVLAIVPRRIAQTVDVDLERIPYSLIDKELASAGFRDAGKLARDSRGSLAALRRLCGALRTPQWVGEVTPPMLAMLLVGAWDPARQGDRHVFTVFDGVSAADADALCAHLASAMDAPVQLYAESPGTSCWRWISREDAMRALGSFLTDTWLRTFRQVALDVLGEEAPAFTMPPEERLFASVKGKVLQRSRALREGIVHGLACLSVSGGLLVCAQRPDSGSALAAWIVRDLLIPDWKRWASLQDVLPVLAEAAPDAFLDALDRSLQAGDRGVARVFAQEGPYSSPHTGLLWALERLGWNAARMPRVAVALARLAEVDPGGKLVNRPAGDLLRLLHPLCPSTRAQLSERIAALRTVCARQPRQGWELCLGMLAAAGGCVVFPSCRPEYLGDDGEEVAVTNYDVWELGDVVLELVRSMASDNVERWAVLLGEGPLQHGLRGRFVRAAQELVDRGTLHDEGQRLWSALRHQLHWNSLRDDEGADVKRADIERLYDALTPGDELKRILWLFSRRPELPERLPGGWREEQERITALQTEAILALYSQPDGAPKLRRLCESCEFPLGLGLQLARMTLADELESMVFGDEQCRRVRPGFFAVRSALHGEDWTERHLKRLVESERLDEALASVQLLPTVPKTWDLLEKLGDELSASYWGDPTFMFYPDSAADADRVVRQLLAVGATAKAFDVGGSFAESLSLETVLVLLDEFAARPGRVEPYEAEQLFKRLWDAESVDDGRVAVLELKYFSVLTNGFRPCPALRLFRALASQPEFFAELIRTLYRERREDADDGEEAVPGETSSPEQIEVRRRAAEFAFHVLDRWKGYPGQDLSGEEREDALRRWSFAALAQTAADKRRATGEIEVAKVLARVPSGPDGEWPCVAARELLEDHRPHFRDGLGIARRNQRGVVSKEMFEGGRQEQEIALSFRRSAEHLRAGGSWPETCAFLDVMADEYACKAVREDEEARCERLEAGEDVRSSRCPTIQ